MRWWPWPRRPTTSGETPAPITATPRPAWRDAPTLQRAVGIHPLIAPTERLTSSLSTWADPSFLAPLGHVVDPDGPAGRVDGLVSAVGVPTTRSDRPELPLRPPSRPSRAPVERRAVLTSAPTPAENVGVGAPVEDPIPALPPDPAPPADGPTLPDAGPPSPSRPPAPANLLTVAPVIAHPAPARPVVPMPLPVVQRRAEPPAPVSPPAPDEAVVDDPPSTEGSPDDAVDAALTPTSEREVAIVPSLGGTPAPTVLEPPVPAPHDAVSEQAAPLDPPAVPPASARPRRTRIGEPLPAPVDLQRFPSEPATDRAPADPVGGASDGRDVPSPATVQPEAPTVRPTVARLADEPPSSPSPSPAPVARSADDLAPTSRSTPRGPADDPGRPEPARTAMPLRVQRSPRTESGPRPLDTTPSSPPDRRDPVLRTDLGAPADVPAAPAGAAMDTPEPVGSEPVVRPLVVSRQVPTSRSAPSSTTPRRIDVAGPLPTPAPTLADDHPVPTVTREIADDRMDSLITPASDIAIASPPPLQRPADVDADLAVPSVGRGEPPAPLTVRPLVAQRSAVAAVPQPISARSMPAEQPAAVAVRREVGEGSPRPRRPGDGAVRSIAQPPGAAVVPLQRAADGRPPSERPTEGALRSEPPRRVLAGRAASEATPTPTDPGAAAVAAGIAQREADGSVVFLPVRATPSPEPPAVQREPEQTPEVPIPVGPGPPTAPEEPPAPPAGAAPAGAPPAGPAPTTNLDDLVRRLYDPLAARLRAELRIERERAGVVPDPRR